MKTVDGGWGRDWSIFSTTPTYGSDNVDRNTLAARLGDYGTVVTWAQAHGLAAIVTDGRVRDAAVMRDLDIPVFARGTTARPPLTVEPVAFDVPVVCGGATVRQGDILVGDGDGLVVVPPTAIADLMDEIGHVEAIEKAVAAAIAERRPGSAIQELVKKKKTRGGRL
jgi:4-hydroxy-4-methyl-2-oxoglutarate aldolase